MFSIRDSGYRPDSKNFVFYDNGHREYLEFGTSLQVTRHDGSSFHWTFPEYQFQITLSLSSFLYNYIATFRAIASSKLSHAAFSPDRRFLAIFQSENKCLVWAYFFTTFILYVSLYAFFLLLFSSPLFQQKKKQ